MGPKGRGVAVKICGVKDRAHVDAAAEAGAAYVGFVFVDRSPRAVRPEDAGALIAAAPPTLATVGLFVDPTDAELNATLADAPIDFIQLHGSETPARVAAVRAAAGRPVIKALGVGSSDDLAALDLYEGVADMLLCDAKPRPDADLPGGSGHAFDWSIVADRRWRRPWLLAGGLTPGTVADAVAASGARQLDVSSGVEVRRGEKSSEKIKAFCAAAASIAV